ncbi:MAG: pitrilysin family protein, partial [Bryobacteraceae bacterium]
TKDKTGDQLDEQLENIAASVETDIGETSGRVSFSALKENTDEVLPVFKQILTGPEFRQDKLDLIKNQLRSAISRRNDNPGGIAAREFAEIVYGKDNPYGWRMEYEHVERIQRQDLIAFYRRYFFPANVMLAVYGDFSTPEMKSKIETLFADWTYQQPPVPSFPELRQKPAPGVYFAAKEDVNQTFFRVGHLGGILRDANYPALEVLADILGGGFRSRLVTRVRTQLGYAYSVGADWGANYNHPGLFTIGGGTKSGSTVETLKVIREEIERIRTSEVTGEELSVAKDTVLNSFVFNFDTPGKTLSRLVTYDYQGYPKDFIFQYQKGVAAVTKADILRVAREYLKPENLTIVAVGNPQEFSEPLSALGLPVKTIDLTIPEPKSTAAKSDPASQEKARKLLARVQDAVGGADQLSAIKDFVCISTAEIQAGSMPMKASKVVRWISPSHMRQDQELPFGKTAAYFDGTSGWLVSPQGKGTLQGPFLTQTRDEAFRVPFLLWLSDRNPERSLASAGDDIIEITSKEGNLARLQVDLKTGLPLKLTYRSIALRGPASEVEERYSDWRQVNGLRLPFSTTLQQGERKLMAVTVKEFKLNTGLKLEDLSKLP